MSPEAGKAGGANMPASAQMLAAVNWSRISGMANELTQSTLGLAEQYERLKLIVDIYKSLASNLELQGLLRAVTANVRRALHCDAAAVSVVSREGNHVRIYALDF